MALYRWILMTLESPIWFITVSSNKSSLNGLFLERHRISVDKVNNVSVIDEVESTNANIEDQAQRKTSQMS